MADTKTQIISLIAAMGENRVIGKEGKLPWHLPSDLKFFKQMTTGKTMIMGRKTWESIGCRPLPHRRTIVVTRQAGYIAPGAEVMPSVEAAIEAAGASEVMIAGGGEIYRAALPRAHRIYLTVVHGTFEGDAFFPAFEGPAWRLSSREFHPADEKNAHAHEFLTFDRAAGGDAA